MTQGLERNRADIPLHESRHERLRYSIYTCASTNYVFCIIYFRGKIVEILNIVINNIIYGDYARLFESPIVSGASVGGTTPGIPKTVI